jgi:hypothetical protein
MRIPIVSAEDLPDCPDCEDKWCPTCEAHYADCDCIGPMNAEDIEIDEEGRLWATKPD